MIDMHGIVASLDPARCVILAGPTASGKSRLALAIAEAQGRTVVNADALQVFADWRVLTARPGPDDLARAPHALYGHVPFERRYSVGDWLREVGGFLAARPAPVIVGGTGLYLSALTEGLSDIPATQPETRARAAARLRAEGAAALADDLDPETRARIDLANPRRVQRAWEVQVQTGTGLAAWHARTAPPLVPPGTAHLLVLRADKTWLTPRIAARLRAMVAGGAYEEVAAIGDRWDPALPAAQAIGAAELRAALAGRMRESDAVDAAILATRRYAKRQRTWFRRRMARWQPLEAAKIGEGSPQHFLRSQ